MTETIVDLTVVRPGRRPECVLFDVSDRTARSFLIRVAAAHDIGVAVTLERDRLTVESPATGTTIYTISPIGEADPLLAATAAAAKGSGS